MFGGGLALDGSTALIAAGMIASDLSGDDPVVYVEELDASSGQWSATQSLTSCGVTATGELYNFGNQLALAGDAAVIGDDLGSLSTPDPSQSNGIACIYTRSNGAWTGTQSLTASDGVAGGQFGVHVALRGDLIAIGSAMVSSDDPRAPRGAIYLFSRGASDWSAADEILGSALDDDIPAIAIGVSDMALDGSTLLLGEAPAGVDVGGIRLFDQPAQATAAPNALALTVASGQQTTATIRIGNAGTGVALDFELADGATLTQMSDETPVPAMGIGMPQCLTDSGGFNCIQVTGTASTSWYRRFYFGEYPYVGASATVDAVTVGIEGAPAGIPVSVRLYTKPHDDGSIDTLDSYQLVPIGEGSAVADGTPNSLLRVPIFGTATIADTVHEDLVVEYHVDDWPAMPPFVPGANASPQTHKTFMTSYWGEYYEPGQQAHLAKGSHILISPHLDPAASGIACATPTGTPWLTATPGEGRIEAGGEQDLAVSVDASYLTPGRYSTELCLATKSPLPSMLRVPVELTVTGADDPIFRDGFDGASP